MKKSRKKGRIVLLWLCILVFFFSSFQVVSILLEYKKGEDFYQDTAKSYTVLPEKKKEAEFPIEVDFSALRSINEDIIGWIYMEDTVVNYPILQGDNNFYYLDKTYYKEYLASGSIFLDTANAADFSDVHSIIYGHNMKNNTMFGNLDDFRDLDYLQTHPYIDILLPDGSWKRYEICSVYRAGLEDGTYRIAFDGESAFRDFSELLRGKNLFREQEGTLLPEIKAGDKILTLSTCTEDSSEEERFVIHARLLDRKEKEKSLL